MIAINFTIPGSPQGKARARVYRQGNFTRAVTPEKTVNYEALVKICFEKIKPDHYNPLEAQIAMTVKAYFGIPKSVSKKLREQMLLNNIRPTKKPDTDNIGKIIADSLNTIVYRDDAQIVRMLIEKYYSDVPRVEVEIREILP